MNILLIEDNPTIIKGLAYAFENKHYQFQALTCVRDSRVYLEKNRPDLIILDIALPDGNGMRLYENTIKPKNIPVIFLTAVDDEDVIVKGLNLGAEDYMTKPFSTKELMARVNRVLVRNRKESIIRIKQISFDLDKMAVERNGTPVELTSLELKLLHLLFLNCNKVVTRHTILDKIWEWTGNDVDDHTVTVYLKRIREKVGNDVITTVKGVGYRVDQDEK